MARPVLTEYLLKLATDPDEFARFRKSRTGARQQMRAAGLTEEQCDVVLSRDSERVHKAIAAETGDILPKLYAGWTRTFSTLAAFDDNERC